MDILSAPHFHDDEAARKYLESILWPNGPVCPACGVIGRAYETSRPGVYRCAEAACREDFTVTMKTVMERSHIALHKWLQAFHFMASSKKGYSAHQLHRTLGITYRSAWFMAHRIREAMRAGGLAPLGGSGGVVAADETYFGQQENPQPAAKRRGRPYITKRGGGPAGKRMVIALVERGGNVRSFHPARADGVSVNAIVRQNIARETRLHTDESRLYIGVGKEFAAHETTMHSHGEYVRGDVHTNTIEGFFSIFKRGMRGVYQHCKEKHLHRYLSEFDFRYNTRKLTDWERTILAVRGGEGKRLTYHQPH